MMCLWTVYSGKRKAERLAKLPKTIVCWKVVRRRRDRKHYYPQHFNTPRNYSFRCGWNTTEPQSLGQGYLIAFHAYLKKEDAEKMTCGDKVYIVKCKTEKADIVAIGLQMQKRCIVTKRIWIPKPKKKIA